MKTLVKIATSIPFLLLLTACSAKTIRDVPVLKDQEFEAFDLSFITKNEVQVAILDERSEPFKKKSTELTTQVSDIVKSILEKSKVNIESKSDQTLTVTVREKMSGDPGEAGEQCVSLTGELFFGLKSKITARSYSCNGLRRASNISLGSDISSAYQSSLSLLFKTFETEGKKLSMPK